MAACRGRHCDNRIAAALPEGFPLQVVVNYASSSGAAEDVAAEIKSLGGDAICVGANSGNKDDMERCALFLSMSGWGQPGRVTAVVHIKQSVAQHTALLSLFCMHLNYMQGIG